MRYLQIASLALLVLGCGATAPEADLPTESGATVSAQPTGTHYSGRVDFDLAAGGLDADLTIRIDPEEATEVAFLISGDLEISQLSGKAVLGFEAAPMEEGASWDRVSVALDPERQPGPIEIRFRYSGQPQMPESRINQITADWVELSVDSAWHPIPAAFDEEFTIDLVLGLPWDWTVVTPGEALSTDRGFVIRNDVPHGDIVFVAAPALDVAEGEGARVYHRGASDETTVAVLEAAATCRAYLDRRFGAGGTLPDGRFVIPDREESGYARKNFIALTRVDNRSEESLTGFLCHELAHFWSSGAAWPTVDNWLNEGFAVLVAGQAIREHYGEVAWQDLIHDWTERAEGQPSIWTPDDLERRPYEVNYKKAPLALARLEQEIGVDAFDRLVVRYMTEPINDTPRLLDVLEEEAGAQARLWFEDVLAEQG